MMIIDRYISRSILAATGVVALVVGALVTLMLFIGELDHMGEGSYGLAKVMLYVALMLPARMYLVLPVVALLGSLLALGALATGSELVVIRSAGVSMRRLAVSVGLAGAVLAAITVLNGEILVPKGVGHADSLREQARNGEVRQTVNDGLWLRQSGYVLRIASTLPGGRIDGLLAYRFDSQGRLRESLKAPSARLIGHELVINHPQITYLATDHSRVATPKQLSLDVQIDPQVLALAVVQPDELSSRGLWRYITYLDHNDIDAADYKLALWRNIVTPFTVWVLVIFALPFAFGSLRSAGAGQRLLAGGLSGLLFFLFNEIVASTGPVYGVPPWLAASLPTILLGVGTVYWMRRVS
ncbi:MAG: LPS export ABC transporter permease LptG [Salinisphaera sp.]|jgi:lipopolysaccharide export system permease protein|nr:LPS export ABC transporter permease LptG [Salinisphaera sp.]